MNDTAEGLTTSDLSSFMSTKGYEWSNEAQVYYHSSYQLPVYDRRQAEKLCSVEINKSLNCD